MQAGAGKRENVGGVLGVSIGLLLLVGLVLMLVAPLFVAPVDGQARLVELFGDRPPPFGLQLSEATRLVSGEELLRLTRPEGTPPGPGEPAELAFLRYRSPAAVAPLFRLAPEQAGGEASMRKQEWEKKKDFSWHTTLKKDEITWGRWRSILLIERAFREGGEWQDSARVDLSQPGRALVLFAQWPAGEAVDEARLREVLRAIAMEEAAPEQP